jgi:hypothetical protein
MIRAAGVLLGLALCVGWPGLAGARSEPSPAPLSREAFEAGARELAGRPDKAHALLAWCDAVLANGESLPAAYLALAYGYKSHALWLRSDYAKAEAQARASIAAAPQAPLGYFFLADALNAELRYDEAFLACLHGADRWNPRGRGDRGDRDAARARCREEYASRVTLTPDALFSAAETGKIGPDNGPVLLSGRISAVDRAPDGGSSIVFAARKGAIRCRLRPLPAGLAPMTAGEAGRLSSPGGSLKAQEFAIVRGVVRTVADNLIHMEECELVTGK